MSFLVCLPCLALAQQSPNTTNNHAAQDTESKIDVTFSGGYETKEQDRGRPVVLIAAALNVPPEVFRKAFSNVKPAPAGQQPEQGQVAQNKETLLRSLGLYGITNDRLDTVSNYYRYNRSKGEMWRNTPADAYATVRNGVVTGITITNAGSGYSSSPKISLSKMTNVNLTATLSFSTDFDKNGSIKEIKIGP